VCVIDANNAAFSKPFMMHMNPSSWPWLASIHDRLTGIIIAAVIEKRLAQLHMSRHPYIAFCFINTVVSRHYGIIIIGISNIYTKGI
jgi:hypothetical protein